MTAFTLQDSHQVAHMLKLALRAVRQATFYSDPKEGSPNDIVRDLLETCDGTLFQNVAVAKAVIDVVKNDLSDLKNPMGS